MLVLFDIDGTLIRSGGVGRRAMRLAFLETVGRADGLAAIYGETDRAILTRGFAHATGRAATDGEMEALVGRFVRLAAAQLAARTWTDVLPGARRLLEAVARKHVVGIATGNLEAIARMKLRHAGLDHFFGFGGYGWDGLAREEMLQRAVERGRQWGRERLGRAFDDDEVVFIGDTAADARAARALRIGSIGVLAGAADPAGLVAMAPDVIAATLNDATVWARLGAGPDVDGRDSA